MRFDWTNYRSGRGVAVPAFSPRRVGQGVPTQPVPLSGQTGQPQVDTSHTYNALMTTIAGHELERSGWTEDLTDDPEDEDDVRRELNTPRYDVERWYIRDHEAVVRSIVRDVLIGMLVEGVIHDDDDEDDVDENTLASGAVRGFTMPLGMSPATGPSTEERLEAFKRFFGGGEYVD